MKAHLIGIGGIGMSSLAHILIDRGYSVTGSDIAWNNCLEQLKKRGVRITLGHSHKLIKKVDYIAYSSACKENNPEIVEAKRIGAKLMHRADLLAEITKKKKSLVVAGAHGKTTTSALLSYVLHEAGQRPSYAIGGEVCFSEYHGKFIDDSEKFVLEGDESDGSFLKSDPFGAIITNIDPDHMEYWKTKETLYEAYKQFISGIRSEKHFFWCYDEEGLLELSPKGVSYGFSNKADLQARDLVINGRLITFSICYQGECIPNFMLHAIGQHNVLNALAVFGLAHSFSIPVNIIKRAFLHFPGVKRRAELRGKRRGIEVFSDYAHHPKEIRATYEGFKKAYSGKRIVCVIEPNRYSRLIAFKEDYISVLNSMELSVVTDVVFSNEKAEEEVLTKILKSVDGGRVEQVRREDLSGFIKDTLMEGDVVVAMGAGRDTIASLILESL